jgi:integrase
VIQQPKSPDSPGRVIPGWGLVDERQQGVGGLAAGHMLVGGGASGPIAGTVHAETEPDEAAAGVVQPVGGACLGSGRTRYRVVVDAGHHADGRRRQVTRTVDTIGEAKAFVSATRADVERGVYIATDTTTVRQACASFVANQALRVREVPARSHESALGHAVEAFGDKRLQHLTRADVERLRDDMTRAGKSGRTVGLTLMLLRSVLAEAQADGLVARNVATRVEGPSQAPKKREALSGDEVAKISAAAECHRLSGCWLSLSGLRRSEVLGLRWSDLSDDGALRVERGRVDVDGRGHTVVGPTKTRAGVRTLPLPPHMRKALATMGTRRDEEMLALGRRVQSDDHLATDEVGRPLRPERYSDMWRELCDEAGVRRFVHHAARHTSVTAIRDRGVPDHIVAAWQGHDEVTMRQTYSHAREDSLAVAGEVIGEVMSGGLAGQR